MIKLIKIILLEPLTHFLILGSLIYLYYAQMQDTSVETKVEQIVISLHEQEGIRTEYKNNNFREISEVELQAYILKAYYDKVLLNEAYLSDLAKHDKQIAKELLKKMKFILLNSSTYEEPSENELLEYYKNNIKEYSEVLTISFSNVYFSFQEPHRIEVVYELLTMTNIPSTKAAYFGDELREMNYMENASYDTLKKQFGNYFASKVIGLKKGVWHKALNSKLGMHIVYVRDKKVAKPYPFDEIEERVYQDFLADRKAKVMKDAYANILLNYSLQVQK